MSSEVGNDVVESLARLAASPAYIERAGAGCALAAFADTAAAEAVLLRLVVDEGDTFVSRRTAAALASRRDLVGFSILARAMLRASPNQLDWVTTGVDDAWMVGLTDLADARDVCARLLTSLPGAFEEVATLRGSIDRAASFWAAPDDQCA